MTQRDDEETRDEGIKVVDRRRFTDEGDEKEDAPEEEPAEETEAIPREPRTPPSGGESSGQVGRQGQLPEVDFVTFILSLSQTAVMSLGLGPTSEGAQAPPRDLQAARWTIDALEMLHEKTQGNLTGEEERIFERILAELRMGYVQVAGPGGGSPE